MMRKLLFLLARSNLSGFFIGFIFQYFSFLLPVNKIYEEKDVVIFKHPVPYWQFHLLAVPKFKIKSLKKLNLTSKRQCALLKNLFCAVQKVCLGGNHTDFQIVLNGGKYQDVPQIHFHIASGATIKSLEIKYDFSSNNQSDEIILNNDTAVLIKNPVPQREKHFIIQSKNPLPSFFKIDPGSKSAWEDLIHMFRLAQDAVNHLQMEAYSLFIEISKDEVNNETLIHLVSGKYL